MVLGVGFESVKMVWIGMLYVRSVQVCECGELVSVFDGAMVG